MRLSIAGEDQIGELRDAVGLLTRRFNNLEKEKDNEMKELSRRFNNLEEVLVEKNNEIMELQEKIEAVQTENNELQDKIKEVRNPPFGYFCSYKFKLQLQVTTFYSKSVITYDKLLYSSQFGLQGDSPGIDINTGKFVSGFSGTWRVDFSLYTYPDPGNDIYIHLYKNGKRIPEADFDSTRSQHVSGYDRHTGGRSLLLHLDLGDELYLGSTTMEDPAWRINFCVSLEQADV